jgi:hypothetical protein
MNQIWREQPPVKRQVDRLPRQAPMSNWYAPQRHPHYVAPPPPRVGYRMAGAGPAPGIPMRPLPQTRRAPFPETQSLAPANGIATRLSATTGLLFGGFIIAAIAMFFPWVTVSVDSPLGGSLYKADASPFTGGWIFAIQLVIAAAVWLAWPTLSGSQISVKRLGGLTAVVGLQIVCLFIGLADYANGVTEKKATARAGEELTNLHVSVGFGLLWYTAAVVAIVVGVVRVWIHRSNTEKRES